MDALQVVYHTLFGTPAILAALAGVAWGIVGGALPGLSSSITMALLMPLTFNMDHTMAIIMLASTYVGAEYGGSIPAILIRTPGTSAAVTTAIDGYEMHRQGRGGEALGISLACGTVGGLFGMILVVALMKPLSHISLLFTAPAFFALGILGLSVIVSMSQGSMIKGFMAGVLGLAVTTIGIDPLSGISRFTFGQIDLLSGIDPVIIMIGVFAVSELLSQAGEPDWEKTAQSTRIKLPNLKMWKRISFATMLGSGMGAVEGATPGTGATVASFMAYNEARRWSKHPEEFGKGSPEGIAAPEAANNTVAATGLVPTLTFGIPSSGSMAVLMGALIVHGIEPGPLLLVKDANFVYSLYAGLFVANIGQLLLGYIMLPPCIWLVNRPKAYLTAGVLCLVVSGVYSTNLSVFEVGIMLFTGVIGYIMKALGFPILPLVLGVVLGEIIERNYRRAVDLGYGSDSIFLTDPVSAILLAIAAIFILGSLAMHVRRYIRERH